MAYKSTTVAAGVGRGVVTATGVATEVGRIGTLVRNVDVERTPLERRLDVLGGRLVWLTLGVAGIVSGLGAWQGASIGLMLQTGIALAVAAVPEALPAVATIALAVGMRRMAARQALVRRPNAESLAAEGYHRRRSGGLGLDYSTCGWTIPLGWEFWIELLVPALTRL